MRRIYVPKGAGRARALLEVDKRRRKGERFSPVVVEGRKIARSFWGERWCGHLESFADYTNRLPRGRTYVRNGSVRHLEVAAGKVTALVAGSEIYRVTIDIGRLEPAAWNAIRTKCTGRIGSVLELLQGRLSERVMDIVTDRDGGLFPKSGEIGFDCSCPDWASMCKHVAAVLYGIGARLDLRPEDLFVLRGVDAAELIEGGMALPKDAACDHALADDSLAGIFGIELDTEDIASGIPDPLPARESAEPLAASGEDAVPGRRRASDAGFPTRKGANRVAADSKRVGARRSVKVGARVGDGEGSTASPESVAVIAHGPGSGRELPAANAGLDALSSDRPALGRRKANTGRRKSSARGDGKRNAVAFEPVAVVTRGPDVGQRMDVGNAEPSAESALRPVGRTAGTGTARGKPSADASGGNGAAGSDIRITGGWLKRLRRRRRISPAGLAERVGAEAETVKLWEASSGEPDLPAAVRAQLIDLHLHPEILGGRSA